MSPLLDKRLPGRWRIVFAVVLAAIILTPLGYSLVNRVVAAKEPPQLFLERPDPQYQNCVRDTEYIRYHHWELLRQTREEVVRYGRRGDVSLRGCRDCHASRDRFCNRCHEAASVWTDCFGCHYYP